MPASGGSGEFDPGMVRLAITVMYLTTFFSLLGLGYPAEHALTLTAAAALGGGTVVDRFLGRPRPPRSRR